MTAARTIAMPRIRCNVDRMFCSFFNVKSWPMELYGPPETAVSGPLGYYCSTDTKDDVHFYKKNDPESLFFFFASSSTWPTSSICPTRLHVREYVRVIATVTVWTLERLCAASVHTLSKRYYVYPYEHSVCMLTGTFLAGVLMILTGRPWLYYWK